MRCKQTTGFRLPALIFSKKEQKYHHYSEALSVFKIISVVVFSSYVKTGFSSQPAAILSKLVYYRLSKHAHVGYNLQ